MAALSSELWLVVIGLSLILSWFIAFQKEIISPGILSIHRKVQPWCDFLLISVSGIFLTALFIGLNTSNDSKLWILLVSSQLLIYSSIIDLQHRIIPNRFLIIAIFIWLFGLFQDYSLVWNLIPSALTIIAVLIINFVCNLTLNKPGFGNGDIKLLGVTALFTGNDIFLIIVAAVFAGGIFSAISLAAGFIKKEDYIPFAPFILLGNLSINVLIK